MPITQSDINQLKIIYAKHFGEHLSNDDAWKMGIGLVNLFRLILDDKREPIDPKKT